MNDKTIYQLLNKARDICHLHIPENDYAWIVSPDLEYLNNLIDKLRK